MYFFAIHLIIFAIILIFCWIWMYILLIIQFHNEDINFLSHFEIFLYLNFL